MSDAPEPPLKARVLEYIKRRDYVSFAELGHRFGDNFAGGGEFSISKGENIVLWVGMTEAAANAISELLEEGAIRAEPTVLLVYLADGACMRLPLVKRNRAYKKPHWLPVTFRPADAPRKGRSRKGARL